MIRMKRKIMTLAVALLLGATTAMAATSPNMKDDISYQTANQVRKSILKLPYYGVFDNIAFEVNGDTVTLYGQVVRPTTKSEAAQRVGKIEGVDRVVNKIEVLPLSGFDDAIRLRTYRAVFNKGSLYRYAEGTNPALHIIVRNGHVTLEGVVANQGDSNLAYLAANSVPGVFSVTNNLRVERRS
ncbi:MAG: BON domain-containing protein [Acidobacteria bacterium]|nr:BON domain-containing protein [Acidobacteriota bacterium]